MKAMWNNTVIAESDAAIAVENNRSFPPDSVKMEYLKKRGNTCARRWKGVCDYDDIAAGGETNADAAWAYPNPSEAAKKISGYFAFWRGVTIAP